MVLVYWIRDLWWILRFLCGGEFTRDACLLVRGLSILGRGGDEGVTGAVFYNRIAVFVSVAFTSGSLSFGLYYRFISSEACRLAEAAPKDPGIGGGQFPFYGGLLVITIDGYWDRGFGDW